MLSGILYVAISDDTCSPFGIIIHKKMIVGLDLKVDISYKMISKVTADTVDSNCFKFTSLNKSKQYCFKERKNKQQHFRNT
jgi:hypothetical protein